MVIGAIAILGPVCLLVVGGAYLAFQIFGWPAGVIIGILCIAAFMIFRRCSDRCISNEDGKTREALESCGTDVQKIIETALGCTSPGGDGVAGILSVHLASMGHAGLVVRIGHPDCFSSIIPLDVPFEPVPIDEFDPRFAQLASPDGPPPARTLVEKLLSHDEQPEQLLGIRRWFARHYWLAIVLCSVAVYELTRMSVTGAWSVGPGGIIVAAACLGFGVLADRLKRASQLFLVPGGVLARRPVRGGRSEVAVFSRRNSVLVTLLYAADSIEWWCADSEGDSCGSHVTRAEAELLLRAWHSPIEAPTVDRLADFQ